MYARAHARNVPINAKTDAVTVQIPVSPNNGACLQLHRPKILLLREQRLNPRLNRSDTNPRPAGWELQSLDVRFASPSQ